MLKKIMIGLILIVITLFSHNKVTARMFTQGEVTLDTLDEKLVCEDTSVTQDTLRSSSVKMRKVKMYLFTNSKGDRIIKEGRFYRQTIGSTEKLGFCVDMNRNHGTKYKADDKEYEKWIANAKERDNDNPDFYAIRIIIFEDAVKEEYKKLAGCFMGTDACPKYVAKESIETTVNKYSKIINPESEEMIYNLAVIMSQISAWALSEGEPKKLMESRYGVTDNMRIAIAQAMCGVYDPKFKDVSSNTKIESCSFDPSKGLYEQSGDFLTWYEKIANPRYGTGYGTEYGFVKSIWDSMRDKGCGIFATSSGCIYNDTYINYVYAYNQGWKKPTLYIPQRDPENEQRLLSDYYCEPEDDDDDVCVDDGDVVCDPVGKKSCWNLNVQIPNACKESDNSGFVKDVEDWGCIFSVAKSTGTELKNHYNMDANNPYCHVYCNEKITMNLPNYAPTTIQGGYLSVNLKNGLENDIQPISFKGTKICRTTSDVEGQINWRKFEEEYKAANLTVEKTWKEYQQALANYKACQDQPYTTNLSTTLYGWWRTSQCKMPLIDDPADVKTCKEASGKETLSTEETDKIYGDYAEENELELEEVDSEAVKDLIDSALKEKQEEKYKACMKELEPSPSYCPPNNDKNISDGKTDFYHARTYEAYSKKYNDFTGSVSAFTEYDKGHTSWSGSHDSYCNSYKSIVESKKTIYQNAVTIRQGYLDSIRSCVGTKVSSIKYDTFNPVLRISYEEEIYGTEAGWKLNSKTVSSSTVTKFYYSGTALTYSPEEETEGKKTIEIDSTTCDKELKNCTVTKVSYERAYWWEKTMKIEKGYTLPDSVYRYIEKGTGQSIHTSDKKESIEYLDMGFGNLPVHYSAIPTAITDETIFTSSGLPESKDHYEFVLYTKSFGEDTGSANKFNKYIFDDNTTFNGMSYNKEYKDYECEYKVNCAPMIADNEFCPDTPSTSDGLNLVYRTISMYSKKAAFPGKAGVGRTPGSNWDDDSIKNKILNNRGISNYAIYTDLDPLYEIELTPGIMQKIRTYNSKKNDKKSVIYSGTSKQQDGIVGYSNYDDFECDANGMNCKSKLIRGLVTDFSEIKVTGCAISTGSTEYNCSDKDVAW